jgi:hypothetical protein
VLVRTVYRLAVQVRKIYRLDVLICIIYRLAVQVYKIYRLDVLPRIVYRLAVQVRKIYRLVVHVRVCKLYRLDVLVCTVYRLAVQACKIYRLDVLVCIIYRLAVQVYKLYRLDVLHKHALHTNALRIQTGTQILTHIITHFVCKHQISNVPHFSYVAHSTQHSASWKADGISATQINHFFFSNTKFHHRVHNSLYAKSVTHTTPSHTLTASPSASRFSR